MPITEPLVFQPADAADLKNWFRENSGSEIAAWIAIRKKDAGKQPVSFDDVVEEAICHGWIDSRVKSIDDKLYALYVTPRKPLSHWTDRNKEIAERMIAEGRMTKRGMDVFALSS